SYFRIVFIYINPKGPHIEYGIHLFERSEEHTSELQSRFDLVCRLLLEKKTNSYAGFCVKGSVRLGGGRGVKAAMGARLHCCLSWFWRRRGVASSARLSLTMW